MKCFLALALCCTAALPVQAQDGVEYWQLVPELRIGSVDAPNYSLTRVGALEVGRDGLIYVAQPEENTIRVFDADGRFLRTIGREGSGPGEFRDISDIGWRADSLWVVDFQQARITMFSPDGEPLEILTIRGPLISDISTRPTHPGGLMADGSVIGTALTGGRAEAHSAPLVRMTRTGELVETFGSVSRAAPRVTRREGGPTLIGFGGGAGVEFSGASLSRLMPESNAVVLVHRPIPITEQSAEFRVELLRSAQDTVFSRRFVYEPRPVGPEVKDSLVANAIRTLEDSGYEQPTPMAVMEEVFRESIQPPPYQPGVSDLVGGSDGTIWLRREGAGVAEVEWNVLDGRGVMIGFFHAPPGSKILRAERGHVWSVEEDDLGVPYVVRYSVQTADR